MNECFLGELNLLETTMCYVYQRPKLTLMILFYGSATLMILGDISMFMIIPNFSNTKWNAKAQQNDSSAPVL